jgi:PAS domain S-box-containing protein
MPSHRFSLTKVLLGSLAVISGALGAATLVIHFCLPDTLLVLRTGLLLLAGISACALVLMFAGRLLKRFQREAAGSTVKFESLLNAAPEAMVITGRNGQITLLNQRAEKLFGFSQQEVLGQPVDCLFTKEPSLGHDSKEMLLYNTSTFHSVGEVPSLVGRCKDGRRIAVELSSSPMETVEGLFIIHVFRDVTERKASERRRAARQAVRKLLGEANTLADAAPQVLRILCETLGWSLGGLWIKERQTAEIHCFDIWQKPSPELAALRLFDRPCLFTPRLGRTSSPLDGNDLLWIPNLVQDATHQALDTLREAGLKAAIACPIVLGQETLGVLELFADEVRDYDENVVETVASIAVKIGQFLKRQNIEAAVRESETRKAAILEAAVDAIITMDHQGQVLEFNPAAEKMFGHPRDEALGRQVVELILPEAARETFQQRLAQYRVTGDGLNLDERQEMAASRNSEEEFPIEATLTRIRIDGPPLFTWYIRDLRERKQAEEALRRSEERYQVAQKMEAIGRLAGGIAHDFNNRLTVINSCTEMLLSDQPDQDTAQEYQKMILESGKQAAALVQQLLAFSRKQVIAPEVVEVNGIITQTSKMLQRLIGEDVSLATLVSPDPRSVKADRGQIEQVLMNLAVNARDAMPEGGKLTLETANVDLDAEYCGANPGMRPGSYVMLAVSDTGCGMTKEVQARIFEPFFTTKELGKGTGLGLATVYGIVKQSGGQITVYSEPGQGSTFKVYLPSADSVPEEQPVSSLPAPLASGTGTVLLVEDEEDVRRTTRLILEKNGYQVLEARHADEALRLCEQESELVDLVVTDVVMPDMNGCQLAERLLSRRPALKVLFMSGYAEGAVSRHGLLEKDAAFLPKPFTPKALASKVRQLLYAS